jgi:tetratricopeptide (TPR) repeat protein
MLKFDLSGNCHLPEHQSLYFCSMIRSILCSLFFLITIMACNNQDQEKKTVEEAVPGSTREKELIDSIAAFPDSFLLKENLIQYYRENDDLDKAISIARELLKKDSAGARAWDIIGTLQFENEDTLNAISSFETALRINAAPRYIILLGSMYAQTKNKAALKMADALIFSKLPETEKEAYFIKGLYYNYTGAYRQAIVFFEKTLSQDHMHMFAYREKGIALYEMGKYEDAIAVLDKAVTLRNNFDEGYYWLGRCLEKQNKPNDAMEEYRTALMYSPDYTEAKEALARLEGK